MQLRKDQRGQIDALIIPLVMSVILVIGLTVFGIWSYMQYKDQKDNVDQKISVAVDEAKKKQQDELEVSFAEREKVPTREYITSNTLGSIKILYPKTWSVYADEKEGSSLPLSTFFHPKFVPSNEKTAYAVRLTVENIEYDHEVEEFDSKLEKGTVKATPIEVSGIAGVRIDGNIIGEFKGSMVLFPLRDKTIKIWTEADTFVQDFNNIILKNLTFEP